MYLDSSGLEAMVLKMILDGLSEWYGIGELLLDLIRDISSDENYRELLVHQVNEMPTLLSSTVEPEV